MLRLTPWRNVRVNTALQVLWPGRNYPGWWNVSGQWFNLQDHVHSNTVKVAYEEIQRGWYTPPLPVRPGDLILDIGAHVGTTSIVLQANYPQAHVIAYEPDLDNYANLVRNIKRNHSRVVPVNAGLWGTDTELVSTANPDEDHTLNTGGKRSRPGRNPPGVPQVPGFTLDSIRSTWGFDRIRVLKLDCEGAEHQLRPADLEAVDSVLVELHGDMGDNDAFLAMLEASGKPYTAQCIDADGQHRILSRPARQWASLSREIPWNDRDVATMARHHREATA